MAGEDSSGPAEKAAFNQLVADLNADQATAEEDCGKQLRLLAKALKIALHQAEFNESNVPNPHAKLF